MSEPREVWIWVENPVGSSELKLVDELIDATELPTADAVQISQKANQLRSDYLWQMVPCRKSGTFVVKGNLRPRQNSLN